MDRQRTGAITTFAVLNIIFGCLYVLVALCSGAGDTKVTVNNVDVTQELKAHMDREIPGYVTYRTLLMVVALALAVGYVLAGIGMFRVANWGRILALACAGLGTLDLAVGLYWQLAVVNPAVTRFMDTRAALGPVGSSFLTGLVGAVFIVLAMVGFIYNLLLVLVLVSHNSVEVFTDVWGRERRRRGGRYDEEDDAEDEDRPRVRRRPAADEDDEPPPRRRVRPRRDEEDEDEDDRGSYRPGPRRGG